MKEAILKTKSVIRVVSARTARLLLRSKVVKQFVKNNPEIVSRLKGLARRLLGDDSSIVTVEKNRLFSETINPDMGINVAEHNSIIYDNKIYYYENESMGSYDRHKNDPRIVAIYLPQFHPFKENDDTWGKGFTEWANVTSSVPRFVGQHQPVLPSDLGFYDLRTPGVMKQQIDLAKKYGIYGFQFYYYWFSGKKVMDMPINTILDNPEWDFNFSICWANENWTKKWDGGDNEIIFEQKDKSNDPLKFIEDTAAILNDKRYICENGKPMLTVYRVELLNDPKRYVDVWRQYFRQKFNKDLWLVGHSYSKDVNPLDLGFDATMDFTPVGSLQPDLKPWIDDRKYLTDKFRQNRKLIDQEWKGEIIDFRFIAKQEIANLVNNHHLYKTISPSWSNEARRKGNGGYTFYNSSPEIFANWLDKLLINEIDTNKRKSPIVYINAWNEWAESAMLEPSRHMGHSSLLRTAEILSKHSGNKINRSTFPPYRLSYSIKSKLAVIVHLFYPDMWSDFSEQLKNIDVPFDLYISIPEQHINISIDKISKYHINTNRVVVPNRGRDVLPFITIMNRLRKLDNYQYFLKLHTKKSTHRDDGGEWFKDVLGRLVPGDVSSILSALANESTGLIGPSGHLVSLSRHMSGNRGDIAELVSMMSDTSYEEIVDDEEKFPFIGSTMFWGRIDFLEPLLDTYLMVSDFPAEDGQIDNTIAHAIERVLGLIMHKITNRKMYVVDSDGEIIEVASGDYTDKYRFAD